MKTLQAKLLKTSISVQKFYESSPILQALNISNIASIIDRNYLELTRSMRSSSSTARPFYIHLIKQHASGEMFGHKDLISRVKMTCKKYGISFLKYIFDDSYSRVVKINITKGVAVQDHLTDSVRLLLGNTNPQNRTLSSKLNATCLLIFTTMMLYSLYFCTFSSFKG